MASALDSRKYDCSFSPLYHSCSAISVGTNKIRYITSSSNSYANLVLKLDKCTDRRYVPLFLAKDIFVSSGILENNVQRINARFCKDGLATRLIFKDFKIEGINKKKLWFYSIQGLFEVVFHYHNKDVQRDCLHQLSEIWLQHFNDDLLPENLTLTLDENLKTINLPSQFQDSINVTADKSIYGKEHTSEYEQFKDANLLKRIETSKEENFERCHLKFNNKNILDKNMEGKLITTVEISTQTENLTSYGENNSICCEQLDLNEEVCEIKEDCSQRFIVTENSENCSQRLIVPENPENCLSDTSKTKCPYCSYIMTHKSVLNTTLSNCLIKLNQFLMFTYSDEQSEFISTFCDVISKLIDFYPKLILPKPFISEFLMEFCILSEKFSNDDNQIRNKFLNFICRFIGKEFHKYENEISDNVKTFKESHIHCIDNLPSPEYIIDEIFPTCMKELIYHWMKGTESSCDDKSDHVYTKGPKHVKLSTKHLPDFHIIQMILEFANNALISGVAHVVYSRLKLLNY